MNLRILGNDQADSKFCDLLGGKDRKEAFSDSAPAPLGAAHPKTPPRSSGDPASARAAMPLLGAGGKERFGDRRHPREFGAHCRSCELRSPVAVGVHTRLQAVIRARELGLIGASEPMAVSSPPRSFRPA